MRERITSSVISAASHRTTARKIVLRAPATAQFVECDCRVVVTALSGNLQRVANDVAEPLGPEDRCEARDPAGNALLVAGLDLARNEQQTRGADTGRVEPHVERRRKCSGTFLRHARK
jgi:hypothetical protein